MHLLGAPVNFRTGAAAGFVLATDSLRVVPGVAPGEIGFFEMKAWLGTAPTYEQAAAEGSALCYGGVFSTKTGGIIDPGTGLPGLPADLIGLQGGGVPRTLFTRIWSFRGCCSPVSAATIKTVKV